MNTRSYTTAAVVSLLLSGCVAFDARPVRDARFDALSVARTVGDCRALLARNNPETDQAIRDSRIDLLNWNIKKGSRALWEDDLRSMAAGKEIVLLQEVVRDSGVERQLRHLRQAAFSEGFSTRSRTTGVATYSHREPVSECRLTAVEPWLRTPKATSIAEFGLAGRSETLVVVNVHAINFSVGLARFRDQMEQVRDVLALHDGPAILSGDFNTWSRRRMAVVDEIVRNLSMSPVAPEVDHRRTFNGHPLDHVFVRGFSVARGESQAVTSSDHNPITVELRL